ncbi:MAG: hypothetical protein KA803_07320 [Rhodoferax sp.]|nr:hypothetical protein [Rhodoferax sp.]
MKLPYFKIKKAFEEAKDSFSYGSGTDKISSTAKLFGKTVANVGMLAVEIGAEVIKKLPEETGKNAKKLLDEHSKSMTDEQKEKAQKAIEMGEEAKRKRIEKEKEEAERKRQEK